ncbi:MAG: FAD-dependent oxidoreductase [Clostridia bacterium]|nr:FAD-dependent oxidoreductase [Clostridia bacterium]
MAKENFFSEMEKYDLFEERAGEPPCRAGCPAGVNAAAYVALIAQGEFNRALDVIRQRMPFPGVCGRVCHHPCEDECSRGEYDEPVSIAALKRAAADFGREAERDGPILKDRGGHRVAVVGSGPAGLTAAYDLRRKGYGVTLFEKDEKAGGMIRAAIPFYRLPEEVVDRDIEDILDSGIDIRLGTEVGKDVAIRELEMYYDAVLVAVGTQKSALLNMDGVENDRVYWGLDFLRRAKSHFPPSIGSNVLVIGGGNVAVDVARTSLRLGAQDVTLTCIEPRDSMPAHIWEIDAALEEGIAIRDSLGPLKIIGNEKGKVVGVEMARAEILLDEGNTPRPQLIAETAEIYEADTVIVAVGQTADTGFLDSTGDIGITDRNLIEVDEITFKTGRPGLFACGDVTSGPKSIVDAVNAGHEAAESIYRYLNGMDMEKGREKIEETIPKPRDIPVYDYERHVPQRPEAEDRKVDFREERYGLTEEEAVEEAKRCLSCGNCFVCGDECILHITGGICPFVRCNKRMTNGPCGGAEEGLCEIDQKSECGWKQIYDQLSKHHKLDNLKETIPPRNFSYLENKYVEGSAAVIGSPRIREILKLQQ